MIPRFSPSPPDRSLLWDVALVGGGILILGLTFRVYPFLGPSFPKASKFSLLKADADHQIQSAKAFLTTHPEDFNAYTTLSMAYYQKGPNYYVEAMNALEKARELGATQDSLFFYAGVMYDTLGLPEYAINELSKYLRHHPNDYEATVRLANLYFHQKRWEDAYRLYKQMVHERPKDPTVWFNYALVNKERGQWSLALSSLGQVRRIAGRLPDHGLWEEGEIYRLQGKEELAIPAYQQELTQHTDYLPALEALEAIARRKGDLKQAQSLHKRLQELKSKPHP